MMKLWRITNIGNSGRELNVLIRYASDSSSKQSIIKEATARSEPAKLDLTESSELPKIPVNKYEELQVLSPAPIENHTERNAVICKRTKHVMQQGTGNTHSYELRFDTQKRWENPLMGWSSSGDPLSNLTLSFASAADAVRYAENQGWNWLIEETEEEKVVKPLKPKSYAENFNWKSRTRVSTK